jgi:hypothetical protein
MTSSVRKERAFFCVLISESLIWFSCSLACYAAALPRGCVHLCVEVELLYRPFEWTRDTASTKGLWRWRKSMLDPFIGLFLEFWGKVGTLLVSRHIFQPTICHFAS